MVYILHVTHFKALAVTCGCYHVVTTNDYKVILKI